MDVEAAIRTRRTHKQYGPRPLDEETVRGLVELARWAPNHKLTNPWRFRLLGPETRAQIDAVVPEQEAAKLGRAPTLVLVTAVPSPDPVLAAEDLLATGAAAYALLLAATGRGFASFWRTPSCFRERTIRDVLGLRDDEIVVALVHLGDAASDPPPKERAPVADIFSVLP